jgi:hypothetical protein
VATHGVGLAESLRGSYGSYGAWLAEGARGGGAGFIWHTIALNLRETVQLLADRFALHDAASVRSITGWVIGLIVVAGAWRMWRRAPVTVAFAAVYFAVLLAWPYTPWRFFFALWPVLVLFIGAAAAAVFSHEIPVTRLTRPLALAVLALVALGSIREEWRAYSRRAWLQPAEVATNQIAPLIRWVSSSTSQEDIVAAEGEQLVYLFTGRRALPLARFTASEYLRPPTAAEGAAQLGQILTEFPVRYVLTISPPVLASASLLGVKDSPAPSNAASPRLVPVAALPGGGVFRVDRQ